MRKLTAIFLLCTFAVCQYTRQLSYLECRLGNSLKASAARCDCEKILESPDPADSSSPAAKTHSHFHPDEFFLLKKEPAGNSSSILLPGINSHYLLYEPDGVSFPPFRPPNA